MSMSILDIGRSRAWIEHAAELNESSVSVSIGNQSLKRFPFRRLRRKLFNCIRAAREDEFKLELDSSRL